MTIDHFLEIFFHSNALAIEILFGVVLLGVTFLTIRSFMRPESSTSEVNLGGLEDGIKKILENYSGASNSNNGIDQAATDGLMEEMATQIERLKLQLMQKTEEVEQLKAGGAVSATTSGNFSAVATNESTAATGKSTPSSGGGATSELEEKVRDLEARLSEYSIIEDDIADLSFYKEETVRLQTEVDKLKQKLAEYESSGPPPKFMAPPPAVTNSAPPPPEKPSSPATDLAPSSPTTPAATSSNATTDSSVDDDIMAEFERAVAEQKAASAGSKVAKELSPAAFSPSESVSTPSSTAKELMSPEIPKGSEVSVNEVKEEQQVEIPSEITLDENGINLEKMMSEVSSLPEQESIEVPNVLEQELDTEKLLKEATGMEKVDVDAINEFGEFIKKEGA